MLVLDESFKRETSGTDIYIAGLRENIYQDTNELQATIINEVLDGFIMAIWNEKLEVRVNSFVINKSHTKVLCVYHNIYDSWAWVGGHADGDEDLIHVVKKEIEEAEAIAKTIPDNISKIKYLGLTFCPQYLHFPHF